MLACYLLTADEANKIQGIIGNEIEKKTEKAIIELFGSVRALGNRQEVS